MLEFIQLIKHRYQIVLGYLEKKNSQWYEYQIRAEQLLYAEAFIRKGQLIAAKPDFPLQIAVIGPTQAGKSSIVNLLLNNAMAGVSPLAGYTVHAHGYCHNLASNDLDDLQHYFGRFQCLDEAMLSRSRYDCYSLSTIQLSSKLLPPCVCWDTPDFDSIDAADYREGVIRTIALADVVVLVVSKEKYADQSVWEIMHTISSFQQPTLICLNKLSADSENEILPSLQAKWRQFRSDPVPEIVPLFFQKPGGLPVWPANKERAIINLVKKVQHGKHAVNQQQLLQRYWSQWLAPVYAEHEAEQSWRLLVDQSIKQAVTNYQRDYLNHPHHYETFQNALLNMLKLLEIPGFARVMGKTRRALTWPIRKLHSLGQDKIYGNIVQEIVVLNQIGEHVMINLADKLLEKNETGTPPHTWWKDTASLLRQKKTEILGEYVQAVEHYHLGFQQDVEVAAQRLYHKLQEQPMILNSLRATRVTTDTAAILLAIQAGGIGVHDLVLAPLMLSFSSLLAESAIGSYMTRVEAELKLHQLNTVKSQVFEAVLRNRLNLLPQQILNNNRFNISEQQCHQAEQALSGKKHGLRLL